MFRPAKNVEMTDTMAKGINQPYPKQKPHYISPGTNFHKNLLSLMGTLLHHNLYKSFGIVQNSLKGYNDPVHTGLIYLGFFRSKVVNFIFHFQFD